MAQKVPIKFTFKRIEKPLKVDSEKVPVISNKDKVRIDEAYKEFFAALFKIKDNDVQRRVLQAVNGQNLTCANCANNIQSNRVPAHKNTTNSLTTQTLAKDFEFLDKINSSSKKNGTINTTSTNNNKSTDCFILNKIQLGRTKRKFQPYAVKQEGVKCEPSNNKMSYLRYNYEPDSLLNKIRRPKTKTEIDSPIRAIAKDYSITEKLLFDNWDIDQSMTPHGFFNFKSNEKPRTVNDFIILSTMEEEMRTAAVCNEAGLYTMHIATIQGDLYKLKRLLVIYKYNKWDVDIRSMDKKETPLHFAMSCASNVRNNEIINLLLDNGADALAINDVGDTILHLAAEAIHDYDIITKLLSKISLDDLSMKNDKSQTILHVAAANNNRTFVKLILNLIDGKLNISSIGNEIPFTATVEYFQQLDQLHLNYVKTFICETFIKPSINPAKAKILNEQDGRTGKTAIFLSLDNDNQSTCLMLLAHFADTRIQDFSNTSCAFYSSEILKNKILAQAVYNADSMHNAVVFKTLKQTERHRSSESRKRVALMEVIDLDDDSDIMTKVAKVLS